jgi:amino acid transporter
MISITTTVFTAFADPFQALGGVSIWLWLPVGAGVVLIALVYGHLAARLPVTGYAYQWASRIVSPHYGWFTGWNALVANLMGSAGISVSLASVFAPAASSTTCSASLTCPCTSPMVRPAWPS